MSKQVKAGMQSLKGNPDYEHFIEAKVVAALGSDKYKELRGSYKKLKFKLDLCIGLLVLKLIVEVGCSTYF